MTKWGGQKFFLRYRGGVKSFFRDVVGGSKVQIWIFAKFLYPFQLIINDRPLKACIPASWKTILRGGDVEPQQTLLENPSTFIFDHTSISINGRDIPLSKLKQKHFYFVCLYPTSAPKCIAMWENIINTSLSIKDVFIKLPKYYHRKAFNLHWNIIHRAIYSEKRLQTMNKSNGICKVCATQEETLTHLFNECQVVQHVWENITGIISNILQKNITLNINDILFCISKSNPRFVEYEYILNKSVSL